MAITNITKMGADILRVLLDGLQVTQGLMEQAETDCGGSGG